MPTQGSNRSTHLRPRIAISVFIATSPISGIGGIPPFVNNGVTEGDYNLFFSIFFNGCSF